MKNSRLKKLSSFLFNSTKSLERESLKILGVEAWIETYLDELGIFPASTPRSIPSSTTSIIYNYRWMESKNAWMHKLPHTRR
ncbi:hypothetical protein VNO77_19848 [Canavalia gladiata]|uniref:Uncharacterized protein n=1 Tax=Canavalia gladiata TaxID=3824 RepID=A0AAN9LN96_CANGL